MEESIKVSVIIPVYNAELYLVQCLDSVIAQTLHEKEIICINDGSTDHSEAILKEYCKKCTYIKYFSQKNQGAGAARNYGLQYAIGKYVAFWDADDIFAPEMLETMYDIAEKEQADVAVCNYQTMNTYNYSVLEYDNKLWNIYKFRDGYCSFTSRDLSRNLFQMFKGWAWDKLYSRKFIIDQKLEFQRLRTSNDGLFVYSAFMPASTITVINKIFVTHRTGDSSSLENTRDKSWKCCYEMLHALEEWMKKTGWYEVFKQSFLNFVLCFFIWNLDTLKRWDSYEQLYEVLKNNYIKQFGLEKYDRDFFYDKNDYEKYCIINKESAAEYLMSLKNDLMKRNEEIYRKQWKVPYDKLAYGCRLAIYGAGDAGRDICTQVIKSRYCDMVLWVDRRYMEIKESIMKISPIEDLKSSTYDYILVAISERETAEKVKKMLLSWEIEEAKIICM